MYARYCKALGNEPLPLAFVDLDALDRNVETLFAPVRAGGKQLRLATKSLRVPWLIDYLTERGKGLICGLMTYTATETAMLAARGARDLLLAYPTLQAADVAILARLNSDGVLASVVVDDVAQLEALDHAGSKVPIPVIVDIDLAYRPLEQVHLGVRRSPLRSVEDVVAFARRIGSFSHLRFHGLMGYEAQIAGLPDNVLAVSLMKRRSRRIIEETRREMVRALVSAGLAPSIFNGGGTGSLSTCTKEDVLTEVTAGSGFLDSHLFDHYRGLHLTPAAYFALQVVRRPGPQLVTCHGGGLVASGSAGKDRLPIPALPEGARLLRNEGAGEVQTPVCLPPKVDVALGAPIFFRHAKAGELAEHFNEYLLVRGDRIEARAPTYRGMGFSFLG